MSTVAIGLNLFLVVMLGVALILGWRLNRRLKALRDSHDSFAKAVQELNWAAQRAEQGLADLRAATDEANDALGERIEKARALVSKLDHLAQQPALVAREAVARDTTPRDAFLREPARETLVRQSDPPRIAEPRGERLGALLAAARGARPHTAAEVERMSRHAPPPSTRSRTPRVDDDLFDEPLELGPLNALRGGRR